MPDKPGQKILFLYSELMGYNIGVIKVLAKIIGNITVVHWDDKKKSNFVIPAVEGVRFIKRSEVSTEDIISLTEEIQPEIIYISGWMDKGYLKAIKRYHSRGFKSKIITGIDNQYAGNLRQRIGKYLFKIKYKKTIQFAWVPGASQYAFARQLGFRDKYIVRNLYAADNDIFGPGESGLKKRIVFVGRLAPVKNISKLIRAHKMLPQTIRSNWPLEIIGNGPLQTEIEAEIDDYILLRGFLQPSELSKVLRDGGVYILPSLSEAWGVAIHEMAQLGFPLLLSNRCGAASEFLIEGYNGYSFNPDSVEEILESMLKICSASDTELIRMKERSGQLAKRISAEISAHALLSIIHIN